MSLTWKERIKVQFLGIRPWKRHSLVLLVAGTVYVFTGVAYTLAEITPEREIALVIALRWAPIDVWGFVWILSGLLAILSSRWPPVAETWGYMVLTGLSAGWGATYAMGVIFTESPTTNLSSAIVWSLVAFMWWAISGLVNPDQTGVTPHDRPN